MNSSSPRFVLFAIFGLAGCTGATDAEICDDGSDNDGDSYTDCDDQDCFGDETCSADTGDTADPPPEFLGGNRPAVYYLPSTWDPDVPMPVFVSLHGYTSSAQWFNDYFSLSTLATAEGAMVITPEGTTNPAGDQFWNATDHCCDFYGSGIDDVAYLSGLIEEAGTHFNIDPQRVYLVGHSNGGFMSYRMACDRSDLIAGVVSLAGSTWWDAADCGSPGSVAVLQAHGTWDTSILFDGLEPQTGVPGAEIEEPSVCLESECSEAFDVCSADASCGPLSECFTECWGTADANDCNQVCWDAATPTAQALWMNVYVCGLSAGCYNDPTWNLAGYPTAEETVARWAERNGCAETSTAQPPMDLVWGTMIDETFPTAYDSCPQGAQATLWTMAYASHVPAMNSSWGTAMVTWLLQQEKAN